MKSKKYEKIKTNVGITRHRNGTTTLHLNHGDDVLKILIDKEDLPLIDGKQFGVWAQKGYVRVFWAYKDKPRKGWSKSAYLHHLIGGKPPKGMVTDHINGDHLDNRKANLRFVTLALNSHLTRHENKTGYRGVRKGHDYNGYQALITHEGNQEYLGSYPTPEAAAQAYDRKAEDYFGDIAVLNFPVTTSGIAA